MTMSTSVLTEVAENKVDNEKEAEATPVSGGELREDLLTVKLSSDEPCISTAVKFLQNPKVRQSPFDKRRAFLERKGLTKAEIDLAVYRSGTGADENNVCNPVNSVAAAAGSNTNRVPAEVSPETVAAVVASPSGISRLKEALNWAVIIGGASYAVYQLYDLWMECRVLNADNIARRKFVAPAFTNKRTAGRKDQLVELDRNVDELRRSSTEMFTSITETLQLVKNQQRMLDDIVRTNSLQRGPEESARMSMVDIKDEIKSLKALLLNKNQFPAVPTTTPVIPSWQLQADKTSAKSTAEAASVQAVDDRSSETSTSEAMTKSVAHDEDTPIQQTKTDEDVPGAIAGEPEDGTVVEINGECDASATDHRELVVSKAAQQPTLMID